jgi:hypothetical protein
VITFHEFDTVLVPLARRFHRSISNDQKPGELNQYWGIGCGSNDRTGDRDYWPSIAMKRGWRTATLHRTGNNQDCEWLEDLSTAIVITIVIITTGRIPCDC